MFLKSSVLFFDSQECARVAGFSKSVMHVLHCRAELLKWYNKCGYQWNGKKLEYAIYPTRNMSNSSPSSFSIVKRSICSRSSYDYLFIFFLLLFHFLIVYKMVKYFQLYSFLFLFLSFFSIVICFANFSYLSFTRERTRVHILVLARCIYVYTNVYSY